MAFGVKNRTVYETTIAAADARSGKPIVNILYFLVDDSGTGTGAYIAGSDADTFLTNIKDAWEGNILPVLSVNYVTPSYRNRAIIGWKWPTPFVAVVGATPALTFTSVTTGSAHGLANGDAVSIQNTVGITGLNGVHSPITVTSATTFTIPIALTGSLSVIGDAQKVAGKQELHYVDNIETTGLGVGGKTGEAIPLFCTASTRRINPGVGRHWKSHIALGPLAESQVKDGKFESTAFTAFQGALLSFMTAIGIGGGGPSANHFVISKALAFTLPSDLLPTVPLWALQVTAFDARLNMGSQISRKPKLTTLIG